MGTTKVKSNVNTTYLHISQASGDSTFWISIEKPANQYGGSFYFCTNSTHSNFLATSAIRLPNNFAVSRSPGSGPSSGEESDGDCVIKPLKLPT